MSRVIDLMKKLSKEDRNYLLSRDRHTDIARADRNAGVTKDAEGSGAASEGSSGASGGDSGPEYLSDEWFAVATKEDLQAELREAGLPVTGTKPELAERLKDYLDSEEGDEGDTD